jgi:SAM-dependent methyltransferase
VTASGGPVLPESPAAERNKAAILEVLARVLPRDGLVLEVASGTGQHVVHFAGALPLLAWQPSDPDAQMLPVLAARGHAARLANLREPVALDVRQDPWPVARADALVCINMIHIAPWSATAALWRGAGAILPAGAPVVLYGPYRMGGAHTAPSNQAFDLSLKARNPQWGVRDLEQVAAVAEAQGFTLLERIAMPANNFSLVFRR